MGITQVHSLEDLKRQCLKPEKKLQSAEQRGGRGRKGSLAGLWRKRGGGAGTKTPTTTTEAESPTAMQKTGEEEGSMEGEGTEDDDEGPNGEVCLTLSPLTPLSPFRSPSSLMIPGTADTPKAINLAPPHHLPLLEPRPFRLQERRH